MNRSCALLATLALALSSPAALASEWQVDPAASTLEFDATQGSQPFTGHFERFSTAVTLDPQDLSTARISVEIDMGSAKTGAGDRDGALPTTEWFDTGNHPEATFTSNDVREEGTGRYIASGPLVIRGKRQEIELPFTLEITGDHALAQGALTLDRTAFGVGSPGEGTAGEAVEVRFTLNADR